MSENKMDINACFFEGKLVSLCCIVFIFGSVVFSYGREKYMYDASGKRNPFIPLITSDGRFIDLDIVEKPKSLNIQGVMYEPNGVSYAIVNTAVVKEGDIVDGSQVIKIEENKVSFIKDGQILELELENGGKDEK